MPTISTIEDDPRTQELILDILKDSEFEVISCFSDAKSAMKDMEKNPPDIALVDIDLPHVTGIQCINNLKPRLPKTHFLVLTTYDDAEIIFEALKSGAVGYLLKRSANDQLVEHLKEVMNGGSPITSSIARKVVLSFHPGKQEDTNEDAESLSERENQVVEFLAEGLLHKEIADKLQISPHTVRSYVRRIYEKLHVSNRVEAIAKMKKNK